MKTTSIISFVILVILTANYQTGSQWQQTGLTSGGIGAIALHGNALVTGGSNELQISTDEGSTWFPGGISYIWGLTANNSYIFVGGNSVVHRSSNLGVNWSQHGASAADGITTLTAIGSTIYAGTIHYGIRRSTDNGANWSVLTFPYGTVRSIDVAGSNIYTALENFGVSVSTNSGANWSNRTLTGRFIHTVKYNNGFLFAGARDSGVYVSSNNGESWIRSSLNNRTINQIVTSGSSYIFAATTAGGVYLSQNNGTTWSQINDGLTDLNIGALLINGNIIYAGTGNAGLWKRNLSEVLSVNIISGEIPNKFELYQNYPNPFNPATKIKFSLPRSGKTGLNVYDSQGRLVETIINSELSAGTYEADFNASNLASGMYFYTLTAGDFVETKKMVLIK